MSSAYVFVIRQTGTEEVVLEEIKKIKNVVMLMQYMVSMTL